MRGDVAWFTWHPRRQVVTVAHSLGTDDARAAVCLALAHRALGHWGDTVEQDVEARTLAAAWLIPGTLAPPMLAAVTGYDELLAEGCGVPREIARVRLGLVCEHLSNAALFGHVSATVAVRQHDPIVASGLHSVTRDDPLSPCVIDCSTWRRPRNSLDRPRLSRLSGLRASNGMR